MLSHQKKYNIEIELKSEKISNFEFLYNMSQKELQILWQYLNEHLVKSFIQSSYSLFVFSILFVKKLNKKLHFCINYWILNAIIIWNQYLIFLIQETLNQFLKTQYFTKFDIIAVFNQIHICESDEKYTAFWTQWKLFEQLIISFNLKNESSIF